MPSSVVWKQEVLIKGIEQILRKHSFPEIEVKIVEENKAYLLKDPPKLPGKELPPETFGNYVEMGASFGLKDTNHSAIIGGEILIETAGSKSRRFVSAFHPFMDVISERLQTRSRPHDLKSNMFPIVMPSQQDTFYATYHIESRLKELKREREEIFLRGMEQTREEQVLARIGKSIEALEEELCGKAKFNEAAGFLTSFGKFKTESNSSSTPGKTINHKGQKRKQAPHRPSLSSWPHREKRDPLKSDIKSSSSETTLDWCLIEPIKGRVMQNVLPDIAQGQKLSYRNYDPATPLVTHWSTRNIRPDKLVIKKGRTTGVTVGKLTKFEPVTIETARMRHDVWNIDPLPGETEFLRPRDWIVGH